MSVTQAIASSRFSGDSMPCQFTEEEIIALADKAEQEERDGVGFLQMGID